MRCLVGSGLQWLRSHRNVEPMNQKLGDWSAASTGQDQPEGGRCNADFHGAFKLEFLDKGGSPGDRRAVSTNQ